MLTFTASAPKRNALLLTFAAALGATACGGGGGGGGGVTNQGNTISGTVTVPDGTRADVDTNDPETAPATNNNAGEAQALENPATVGGFVTNTATGEQHDAPNDPLLADRFADSPDRDDYYSATLADGQTIALHNLNVLDPVDGTPTTDASLVLRLLQSGIEQDSATAAVGDTASLQVSGNGEYTIQVQAQSGTGVYQLELAPPGYICDAGAAGATFVPGEALVRLKAGAVATAGAGHSGRDLAADLGMRSASGLGGRTQLWDMGDPIDAHARLRTLGLARSPLPISRTGGSGNARAATLAVIRALEDHPDVESAMPNFFYQSLEIPSDTYFGDQWNLTRIDLPAAWDISTGTDASSAPVRIGIVDTGVYTSHEDLQDANTGNGYDFVNNDASPEDISLYHGSHVAGIAAAATNNMLGVAGAGRDATFIAAKVLGESGGTLADAIEGARYAAGLSNRSGTTLTAAERAQIINMSLGGTGGCLGDTASEAFDEIRRGPDNISGTADDVILVAAAGNNATDVPVFPAAYGAVLSVSAIDHNDGLAGYSSYGPFIDVAAPGGDTSTTSNGILSTVGPEASGSYSGYAYYQGTSMASPHVAGVAALMKAVYGDLNADLFETALKQGRLTEDLSSDGATVRNDQFGYGLIDAAASVTWADSDRTLDPMVTASPQALYFEVGGSLTETLTIRESSGDDLSTLGTITVSDNQNMPDWLTTCGTPTNGQCQITVDPDAVGASGTFSGTITVDTTSGGSATIPVVMRKAVTELDDDASVQYILLVNASTNNVVQQTTETSSNGSYSFSFSGVPNGTYILVSGSDVNNDSFVCWTGEACGIYPFYISVTDSDSTGLTFATQFESISAGRLAKQLDFPIQVKNLRR